MRIVVPDDFPPAFQGTPAHRRLAALGEVIIYGERGAEVEAELIRRIGDAEVVLNIRAYARFTEAVFGACPRLRLISIWGTGVDNVDLAAAARHGVTVTNTPEVNADAVAEHALALMLALARRVPAMDRAVKAGEWPRGLLAQLRGKTLGVVGLGAIGRRVAQLGRALGMRLLAWTPHPNPALVAELGVELVGLEDLLAAADVVSLHLRLTPETEGLLDRARLGLMRPGALLINTARGALVEREALLEALQEGRLGGAGLDVFHDEPLPPDDPLLGFDHAILTPHNAGMTPEVIEAGLQQAVENIERFLQGRPTHVVTGPA
ncbi:MAG: phosphoglycerate dehydrogenase [Candidatus Rokubacteria bacterium]|nr:phosphoglycerate dehydrogenase [Candidatus Rokubacteria bacterium]